MTCDPAGIDHDIDDRNGHERDDYRNEDFPERRYGDRCRRCGVMVWSEWEPVTAADYREIRDEEQLARWKEGR